MLDLQPRVHLQKVEIAVAVDDELHRAGAPVADRLGKRDGLRAHRGARGGVEERRRRLLDDLLVAALDGAFALAEVDDVAMRVGEHLDLDVPRLLDELLDEDAVVAEGGTRFRAGERKALPRLRFVLGDAHALAAAAGRGLQHHRIADPLGDLGGRVRIGNRAEMAGHRAHAGLGGEFLRLDLVAHRRDRGGRRPDEDDAGLFQRFGEGGIFRQESVAGMHGRRTRLPAGFEDPFYAQVALGRRRRADRHRLVGHLDMSALRSASE